MARMVRKNTLTVKILYSACIVLFGSILICSWILFHKISEISQNQSKGQYSLYDLLRQKVVLFVDNKASNLFDDNETDIARNYESEKKKFTV